MAFFKRQWFLLALAVVLAIGFGWAPRLEPITSRLSEKYQVFAVLFLMALPVDASSMWRAVRYPGAVLLATAIGYVLVPLLAWGWSHALDGDFAAGLLIAASIPTTLASAAVWTRRAGGNDSVSVMVTMLMNFICFAVTPWLLKLTTGRDVQIEVVGMMQKLALYVVLPMFLAQALRINERVVQFAAQRKVAISTLAQCGILFIVLLGSVTGGMALRAETPAGAPAAPEAIDWALMISGVLVVHLLALAAGHLLGGAIGLDRIDRIAVGFSGSQKTLAVGLYLANTYFPGLALLPLITFHVSQLLVDASIADWLRAKGDREVEGDAA